MSKPYIHQKNMRYPVYQIILAVSISFLGVSQSAIDGFLKGKNTLDLAGSASCQSASTYRGGTGDLAISRDFFILNAFGEYGVSDKFDVIATVPFINSSFQDASAYGKYQIASVKIKNQKLTILPALGFSIPLTNYQVQGASAIGQRATQFHGHLVAQVTLPHGFYWQAQGAYHYALDPVPSSYKFSSKLMYTKNKLYMDFWYEYQKGLGTNTYPGTSDFRTLTVDYQRVGGVVFYNLKNNWGTFINASYIFEGLDTFLATTVSLGVTKKLHFSGK